MVEESVVKSVRRYLTIVKSKGIDVSFGMVFGSQVRGTADADSDIDLIVVAPYFDTHRTYEDKALLWRVILNADSRIEPIPAGEQEWYEDTERAILEIARREGERIDPEETPVQP
jgi:predicted nucleotidyltransferase